MDRGWRVELEPDIEEILCWWAWASTTLGHEWCVRLIDTSCGVTLTDLVSSPQLRQPADGYGRDRLGTRRSHGQRPSAGSDTGYHRSVSHLFARHRTLRDLCPMSDYTSMVPAPQTGWSGPVDGGHRPLSPLVHSGRFGCRSVLDTDVRASSGLGRTGPPQRPGCRLVCRIRHHLVGFHRSTRRYPCSSVWWTWRDVHRPSSRSTMGSCTLDRFAIRMVRAQRPTGERALADTVPETVNRDAERSRSSRRATSLSAGPDARPSAPLPRPDHMLDAVIDEQRALRFPHHVWEHTWWNASASGFRKPISITGTRRRTAP